MILLLDTTVLIDVLRRRRDRPFLMEKLLEDGHTLATSVISVGEIHAGMRRDEEFRAERLLGSLVLYPVSGSTGQLAGALKREQRGKGRTVSLLDMLVAATAIEHSLTLMTDNLRDFPMPELKLYPMP